MNRCIGLFAFIACLASAGGESPSSGIARDGRIGLDLLDDGKMNPACVWSWRGEPIEVVTDLGGERDVGGVRILSGRSWVNCCVKRASFYALVPRSPSPVPLLEHFEFRPANTYKELFATWKPVRCPKVKMVIEDTYDFKPNYYSSYTHKATPHLPRILDAPPYPEFSGPEPTVQIAELAYFGKDVPADLPLPNADGARAYPESRLIRDWAFQSCTVSNVSHCANVEPDTTRPDPLGEDVSTVVTDAAWKAKRAAMRRDFLAAPKDYQYNVFDMHTQFGPQWAYPFPLGGGRFLVSFMPEGCRYYRGPYSSRFGVYAMDESGRRELLAFDWGNHCMQPVALKRRTPPRRVLRKPDYANGFGTYYVQDVYEGLPMKGVRRGDVSKLRVVALEWRPVHNGWNWQFGYRDSQGKIGTPVSVGNGAYDVKHVLGEADIEADGSCTVSVPARTPVYFQLVDRDGCVIQTMRSWSTLMPGELNSCVGCHEHPNEAGATSSALALAKPAQRLGPCPALGARIDLRDVSGDLPASDDKSFRAYTKAYLTFSDRGACTENVNFSHGLAGGAFMPPRSFGACRSRWFRMLREGHPDRGGRRRVSLSDRELRTIALWIDLCVPFGGSYFEGNKWDDWHLQRFLYTYDKRIAFYGLELNGIRAKKGLDPVAFTGFVPNVAEPRKQRRWDE